MVFEDAFCEKAVLGCGKSNNMEKVEDGKVEGIKGGKFWKGEKLSVEVFNVDLKVRRRAISLTVGQVSF